MSRLKAVADRCVDKNYATIYRLIDRKLDKDVTYTKDGAPRSPISHSADEVAAIKNAMMDSVKANYNTCGGYISAEEARKEVKLKVQKIAGVIQKDGFYNPASNIGTDLDVGNMGQVSMPLLMMPQEASALYASGGLGQIIIDKKSKGTLLNGYAFTSSKLTGDQLLELREYADGLGFATAIADALRDGNIYGGSMLFPMFKGDSLLSLSMTKEQLMLSGMLKKGCISHFAEVDRWNVVVIPEYDLCAMDYMAPRTFYVPISGFEVNSDRAARVVPKPLPYWAAIRQLGWGTSDYTGYYKSLVGYEIMALSLPIMCQQMSLVYHTLPLDGIIAQNGPSAAKKWQKENEQQMRNWSILNPKAINSFGELGVLNRSYTGFESLIDAVRKDVSAKSGIPESVLFYTQPNGIFNKNEDDVLLKQTETIKLIQKTVADQISKCIPFICCSLWGCDSLEQLEVYDSVKLNFDTPVVSSPTKKADVAMKMGQAIQTLVNGGFTPQSALNIVTKIVGEVEMPSDIAVVFTEKAQSSAGAIQGTDANLTPQTANSVEGGPINVADAQSAISA